MKSSLLLLALIGLAAIGELALAKHSNLHEWTQYKKRHGKVYETLEEEARRFSLYLAAREQIRQHNANEQASYKMGLSHLSDRTQEEFAQLNGLGYELGEPKRRVAKAQDHPHLEPVRSASGPLADEIDWRQVANRVSSVKDQGECASGWAFAAAGVLEGQETEINRGAELISLSAQQLVDCSEYNKGCQGGTISNALTYVASRGIEPEQAYPYVGPGSKSCNFSGKATVMSVVGAMEFTDEVDLKTYVARFGPVAVGVHVNENFKHYKSGIFNDPTCGPLQNTDHAALVVGYGTDSEVGDYWIVKNSWSPAWGEEGYIRIKRGLCGIGELSVVPYGVS
uniref:Cathepsin L n=1 Tax=Aceria tosichella TaxID=561515 RepID=A0A6G1S6M6_9ACAR